MPPEVVIAPAVSEGTAEAQTEAAEAVADASVEIARIQADANVAIATDANDTAVELAEIEADETDDEDLSWLQDRLEELRAWLDLRLSTIETRQAEILTTLQTLLILIPPPAAETTQDQPETVIVETPEETPVSDENIPAATPEKRRVKYL